MEGRDLQVVGYRVVREVFLAPMTNRPGILEVWSAAEPTLLRHLFSLVARQAAPVVNFPVSTSASFRLLLYFQVRRQQWIAISLLELIP